MAAIIPVNLREESSMAGQLVKNCHYTHNRLVMSVNARLQQPTNIYRRILFGMKSIRLMAAVLGAIVVLYFLVINFLPEDKIVGFHFRWPWSK
jgi:hypothetical protein